MEKPQNVRADLWERFKKLEKRTDDLVERKKIKLERYNKKKNKNNELAAAEQSTKHSSVSESEKQMKKDDRDNQSSCSTEDDKPESKEWQDVKQYLNINNHLQESSASSSSTPKSGLEKKINNAISFGDFETAISLSDRLATREFGTKIAASFDAREYLKRKKEEEMSAKAKKKKKLHWGFEHKQRWEMKGNM